MPYSLRRSLCLPNATHAKGKWDVSLPLHLNLYLRLFICMACILLSISAFTIKIAATPWWFNECWNSTLCDNKLNGKMILNCALRSFVHVFCWAWCCCCCYSTFALCIHVHSRASAFWSAFFFSAKICFRFNFLWTIRMLLLPKHWK